MTFGISSSFGALTAALLGKSGRESLVGMLRGAQKWNGSQSGVRDQERCFVCFRQRGEE